MANSSYLSREEAQRLAERVLSFSRADEARVNIQSGMDGNTRFAVNQISTAGDVANVNVVVTSAFGKKVASANTNRLDDESLRRVVDTAEQLARLVPEDPEYMGELGQQQVPRSDSLFESTANLDPEVRARAVREVTEPAAQRNLVSTGFLVHRAGSTAVATSRGHFAYDQNSQVNFTTTVRTPDGTGSGWAGTSVHDWNDLDTRALGEVAIEKALASRNPRAVEPGRWTVVMEPTAVGNMVGLMVNQFGARAADEGRSFFAKPGGGNRIGERFIDERVSLYSDPGDPQLFSSPFSSEGLPNRRVEWVQNGTLRHLDYDRFWAAQRGGDPTGFPSGFHMSGGNATLDEMIRSTERGLLLTRFWYIRGVDPRTILFTGLTRDGTFLIENGRIAHPVQNLRWNESPIFMLNNIEMMGQPVRISSGESGGLTPAVIVPPLKVRDFSFTSLSDAV
jgi:predicted Zn-dependent protease